MKYERKSCPKLDDTARIRHMLDAAHRACEVAQGEEVGRLDPEAETALALTRLLEILGETAKNVTSETQAPFPEVPWRDYADTRNRIIHQLGYPAIGVGSYTRPEHRGSVGGRTQG